MMEQVELLKSNGDAQGLIRFFLDQKVPDSVKRGGPVLMAKQAAVTALAELGTPEALDALVEGLEGSPEQQSYMLANALAAVRSPKAVEALTRIAREHEDKPVRSSAVGALAANVDSFGSQQQDVFDLLEAALADVPFAVAHYLRAKDPRVVDLLTRAMADSDEHVREMAAGGLRYLGAIGDPRAADILRSDAEERKEALKSDVRALAERGGWPVLGLEGSSSSGLIAGAVLGLFIGLGILLVLTRGDLEGVLELLSGGGGGVGLIIMAVTILGGATWGFVKAKSKEVKAGQASWDSWLASAPDADLKNAKAKLGE
jgi:hypothetical protein